MRALAAAMLLVSVSGCAVMPPDTLPEPVLCTSAAQCLAMWNRAQLWVAQKAGFPLLIVTDVVIQTQGPRLNHPGLAVTVTRHVEPDGAGMITARLSCGSAAGCIPGGTAAGRDFRDFLIATP